MGFVPSYNLLKELEWRGLLHDSMPGVEQLLMKEKVTAYVGFDPTADSLHIGNLVPIILLVHLQKSGHQPIALVGGATGLVGDPSGKREERVLQDKTIINQNLEAQKKQLEKFIDFNHPISPAIMVNNYDWFKDFSFLGFIRDVGKYITVNYMLSKDSVKNRMENGISFTEFTYQLVQGYDFLHLYQNYNCKLQMGGSDQWGNITTGTELIRKMNGGEAYAITTPLITKADGSKFGKSEGGNVWLDASKTSAFQFYQFWMNIADDEVEKYLKIFTFLSQEQIADITKQHQEQPHLRIGQKTLAKEITIFVHSEKDYEMAIKTTEILFGNTQKSDLETLNATAIEEALSGVPCYNITKQKIEEQINILDLLVTESSIFPSKSEAKKMISSGAVSINKEKIGLDYTISPSDVMYQQFIVVQKGKKNYYLIKVC